MLSERYAPAVRRVTGQSSRTRPKPVKPGVPPLHSLPSCTKRRVRPAPSERSTGNQDRTEAGEGGEQGRKGRENGSATGRVW